MKVAASPWYIGTMAKLSPTASHEEVAAMNEEAHEVIARQASAPPTPEPDPDTELVGDEGLSQEVRFARWQARRPPIGHLASGIAVDPGDGSVVPLFDVGDRIVVDRRTMLLRGTPWLETIVGKVRSIDDESGLVTMFDEDSDQRAPTCRYTNYKDPLHDFRLAPLHGNPFEPPAPPKKEKPQPTPGKKGRGRPKGSKNRPKEVIQAEREARKAARKRAA